ncbi:MULTISPECIES: ArsR family transcriptional regulator [Nocardiaceae]|uniref:ArsR family transcriptional regulator n=1 Tax=Nocardiaceae TaxID=85025 RepID=UPI001F34D08F|nr:MULTISPECIES: ArsR family transcriptional regulator [Rhodococcus]
MTRERHHRALVLYLLLLAWWPWLHDRKTPLDSEVWIRALTAEGPDTANALTWSPSTLSRAWGDLKSYGLVDTKREGRLLRVTPRREDGLADYEFPQGQRDLFNRYFTLPDEFWTKQYFATLSPAALAVLLIVLKETIKKPDVELLRDRMQEWYGISGKTVTKGIQELGSAGLLGTRVDRVRDVLAKYGVTDHYYYGLEGPFSTEERIKRRRYAKRKRNAAERKKAKAASGKEK